MSRQNSSQPFRLLYFSSPIQIKLQQPYLVQIGNGLKHSISWLYPIKQKRDAAINILGYRMKPTKTFDITGKARIYHILAQMSSSFSSIIRYCEELELAGALARKYKRLFQAFTIEIQGELNLEVLDRMKAIEIEDWTKGGKVRARWEKYLLGRTNKRTSKKPR